MLRHVIIAVAFLAASSPATADLVHVRVVTVIDGDTIRAVMPWGAIERIRVLGIDAPELGERSPCPAFGERAKLHLAGLLRQGPVTVETGRRDRYERVLGVVRVSGQDVAPLMIEARLARPYDGGYRQPWCGA
ncbi:MAG: hypothetical protein FJX66_17095 [Alphaproteobacteria bacterium]|nr:hypothetical protein [Alphaproteobacteria bacterium]